MKKMFKLLSIVLICVLTISMIGCSKKKGDSGSGEQTPKNAELKAALEETSDDENSNYTMTINSTTVMSSYGISTTGTTVMKYSQGKCEITTTTNYMGMQNVVTMYTETVTEGNAQKVYLYSNALGTWTKQESPADQVDSSGVNLDALNPENFTFENGKYKITNVTAFDGAEGKMVYDVVEITIADGHINTMYISGTLTADEMEMSMTMDCTFSNFGSTSVTLPVVE